MNGQKLNQSNSLKRFEYNDKEHIITTPTDTNKPRENEINQRKRRTRYLMDDSDDENIDTPPPNNSSGWLDKRSSLKSSSSAISLANHLKRSGPIINKKQPLSTTIISTKSNHFQTRNINNFLDNKNDKNDKNEKNEKNVNEIIIHKKQKIIHDSDDSEIEVSSIPFNNNHNGGNKTKNEVSDLPPTLIYQLEEDNITKLLKERENSTKRFQHKVNSVNNGVTSNTTINRKNGCSLSHTNSNNNSNNSNNNNKKIQNQKQVGRLLKKKVRSLSLTDSDVDSDSNVSFKNNYSKEKYDVILLDNSEQDDNDDNNNDDNDDDDNNNNNNKKKSNSNNNQNKNGLQKIKAPPNTKIVVLDDEDDEESESESESESEEEESEEEIIKNKNNKNKNKNNKNNSKSKSIIVDDDEEEESVDERSSDESDEGSFKSDEDDEEDDDENDSENDNKNSNKNKIIKNNKMKKNKNQSSDSDETDEDDSDTGEKWYGSESDSSINEESNKIKRRHEISDDDNDDEDEDTVKREMERKCKRVLQRCSDVSKLLRRALLSWNTNSNEKVEDQIGNCVSLISIHNPIQNEEETNSEIISQDLITTSINPKLILKDYQLVGVNWLKLMHTNDVNGVLADDMGLGKTVQTITFLGWLHYDRQRRNKSTYTHLIVVPASTLANWMNEFTKFCPQLKVLRFHGTPAEKSQVIRQLKKVLLDNSRSNNLKDRVDIVLTTYTLFERESGADDRKFLRKLPFEYLVLDEAHCIKNSQSSRYYHLRNLKTKRRLLLSGTPVQNDVRELLSLLGFLMPQVFKTEYREMLLESFNLALLEEKDSNLTKNKVTKEKKQLKGKKGKDEENEQEKEKENQAKINILIENENESVASLDNLRAMLAPFVLRRLKRDVLNQLVGKDDHIIKVKMTDSQSSLYGDIIEKHMIRRTQINKAKKNKNKEVDTIDLTVDTEKIIRNIGASEANNIFTALRKAANHPLLLRVHYSDDSILDIIATICYSTGHFGEQCDIKRIKNEISEMSDFDINSICLEYPSQLGHLQLKSEVLYESPKMRKLEKLLPQLIENGHRMLIFSQWTKMLDIIGALMEDMGLRFLRLDGSTPVRERQKLIDQFEKDKTIPIFILSTKAGGLGINLTAADTVIIHDLDFNPENDRQAEDRCHRIGQTKKVNVYKLVTEETVDEIIFETGQRKQRLSKAVLSDNISNDSEIKEGNEIVSGSEINKMLQIALQKYVSK